jgi:tetratricopeptide (TPR) repeat protein
VRGRCPSCGWDAFDDATMPDSGGLSDERTLDEPPPESSLFVDLFGGDDVLVGSGEPVETLRATVPLINRQKLLELVEQSDSQGFLDAPTRAHQRVVIPASVRVDLETWEKLAEDVVLKPLPGFERSGLSIFERVILGEVDGERPNARVAARCKVTLADARIALSLLLDKGALELAGYARPSDLDAELPPVEDTLRERPRSESAPEVVQLYHAALDAEASGEHDRALLLLDDALRADPGAAPVWNRRGLLLASKMDDVFSAIACVEKAMALTPENLTYKANLAKVKAFGPKG